MDQGNTALALATTDGMAAPIPLFSGPQMEQAFTAYRTLQVALDRAMPDQIMTAGDKAFRKKGYWRAVAVAFDLSVDPVEERREVSGVFEDGRENFGYLVTYRATYRNRSVTGDGACFASEKAKRRGIDRWQQQPPDATEHNVRAHAHTRAFNRAVSNLVAFGEVSAEEMDREDDDDRRGPQRGPSRDIEPDTISDGQRKRLYAISKECNWTPEAVRALLQQHGFEHSNDVTRVQYDAIITALQRGPQP